MHIFILLVQKIQNVNYTWGHLGFAEGTPVTYRCMEKGGLQSSWKAG